LKADEAHLKIAVDAMGGDHAPESVVAGAIAAVRETGNRFEVLLVGPEAAVRAELGKFDTAGVALGVVDAPQVIDMHDDAMAGVRQKKQSSISVGITLHKEGGADAFVSAGHSGAVMSGATLILGRITGVSRPTIGTFFPTVNGIALVVDAGANVDCKPQHLAEFARMGSVYTRLILGIEKPRVGLLSIGEESSKGNDAVKEAHGLLQKSGLNFIGNIEGNDVLKGTADVVVCDGFTGNILLKFAESVPGFFKQQIRSYAAKGLVRKLKALVVRPVLKTALANMDYEEYGGVPVLGVNGVVLIGHGKSSPKAIKNLIFRAEELARRKITHHIQEALSLP
jgi:phosphate acyltransferase